MLLGLIVFPMLAILALAALVALAGPRNRFAFVLPAVRTIALVTAATIYVAALIHGART
ncbi:hypothetical protein Q5762_07380 [Streptomyces sp. P9(2023)]|uniref:hypothetical protein n=1 Tax=Streptomyces sp. P9(2023) TaxID=3064394 RepID=UPI0028F4256B|nr:hypothetical protein [Streptomyces sp. P9(2023)]MDT9688178.1 hypothetical protein [Streptomyces sp. P9(2023)]